VTTVEIPNRAVFRAQEVCEIADVQPYVLRTWEAEFPDLGVSKTANGPRLYRRSDVERVLRIKHLILVDGLTLAGVRRQLGEEKPAETSDFTDEDVAKLMDGALLQQLRAVRNELRSILDLLSDKPGTSGELPFDPAPVSGARARGADNGQGAAAPKRASTPAKAQKPAKGAKAKPGKKR
jgi:DNA-binding transcriptional MerR regulator